MWPSRPPAVTEGRISMPSENSTTAPFTSQQRQTLLDAHERLCFEYGCPIPYFHHLDPLSELVSSLLSHRTRNSESGKAFKALRQKFPSWEAVRDAPAAEVEAAIVAVTWPEQKAPRIQEVLRQVGDRRAGAMSLDFLAEGSEVAAREWLESLPGVGPKTSAAVLSFSSLRRKALPVDSHHHRVAVRLGVIPASLAVGPSHRVMEAMLPPEWNAQQVYDHHEALMLHGQKCCFHAAPACGRCVVLGLCPFGQSRLGLANVAGRPAGAPTADEPQVERPPRTRQIGTPSTAPHPGQAEPERASRLPDVPRPRRRTTRRGADEGPGLFS